MRFILPVIGIPQIDMNLSGALGYIGTKERRVLANIMQHAENKRDAKIAGA